MFSCYLWLYVKLLIISLVYISLWKSIRFVLLLLKNMCRMRPYWIQSPIICSLRLPKYLYTMVQAYQKAMIDQNHHRKWVSDFYPFFHLIFFDNPFYTIKIFQLYFCLKMLLWYSKFLKKEYSRLKSMPYAILLGKNLKII